MAQQQQPPNFFKSAEIVKRLLYTLGLVSAYIVGRNIPIPGLHPEFLGAILSGESETALRTVSVFGLGVAPYIVAAVLLSVLRATGRVGSLAGKDAEGRRGIYKAARVIAAVFAACHAVLAAMLIERMPVPSGTQATVETGLIFLAPAALTFAAGAMLVLWLAEELTDKGIGNGILLFLFVDVAAGAPGAWSALYGLYKTEEMHTLAVLGIIALVVLAILASVWVEAGQRKVPVQYAKRVIGRMMVGAQQTTIPVKLNPAGVLALVAAATVVALPMGLFEWARHPAVYLPVFTALVIWFSWIYRTANVDPRELAGQIQQTGGFIAGTRSGDALVAYFWKLLDKLSIGGAMLVAAIAVTPAILTRVTGSQIRIGELSIFLVAAVSLDFMAQMQTRYMMQNYGGNLPQPGNMPRMGKRGRPSKRRGKKRRR